MAINLNVLLVEDDPHDLETYVRDFPSVFEECGISPTIHPQGNFEAALALVRATHIRFDLILSDTFRGDQKNRDAAVVAMVENYRAGRFCPLIVFSASAKPESLDTGAFVSWADKSVAGEIEAAIKKMIETGIPQLARSLHDELDRTAGGFLWEFLEKNWSHLWPDGMVDPKVVERLVRRRAALRTSEISDASGVPAPINTVVGLEYYIYPPLHNNQYRLGHILKNKTEASDVRVVLTPHCHLTIQQGHDTPRAEHVLTARAIGANVVLGPEKIAATRALEEGKQLKKLKSYATPPSGDSVGRPEGRYWYLPAFLDIPHCYCDYQQIESISHAKLTSDYLPIATLTPPFAESLQACFVAYYGGVGIPNIRPESIVSLLAP